MFDPTARLNEALSDRYRIERKLGEGGMATVYLAEDLKHKRQVAIKVLKPELGAVIGGDRFVSEIETTAALQHPHILPLFDSGEAAGFLYYVMPYVDGESLRDRLDRERQLSVDEAVRIAVAVASALHYAHERGVVHRDIKPANILLHAGQPVVADFGIALAISAAGGGRLTETGMSVGTPHYMSPEQASAQEVDARSDIYSMACVLYEMLVGDPPHTGPNAQVVLSRILTEEPRELTSERKSVPRNVSDATAKALSKLPADRFPDAREFGRALQNEGYVDPTMRASGVSAVGQTGSPAWKRVLPWGLAAIMALVAAASLTLGGGGDRDDAIPLQTTLALDPEEMPGMNNQRITISRDGSHFMWVSDDGIRVRGPLDEAFRLIEGTEGAERADFSPNGEWLVFSQSGDVMRVSVDGGGLRTLVDRRDAWAYAVSWRETGWLVFDAWADGVYGWYRVPESGGRPEVLVQFSGEQADLSVYEPVALPGGAGVLGSSHGDGFQVVVWVAGEDSIRTLVEDAHIPRYVEPGYLLYGTPEGDLFAQRFDLGTATLTGSARPVLEDVYTTLGFTRYDVSDDGTLVYGSGTGLVESLELGTVDFEGVQARFDLGSSEIHSPRWDPEGRRVTFYGPGPERRRDRLDVWMYDTESGTAPVQLTEVGQNSFPVWSPDGDRIAFTSDRDGIEGSGLFVTDPTSYAPPELIWSHPSFDQVEQWLGDSSFLVSLGPPWRYLLLSAAGDTSTYYSPNPAEGFLDDARISPDGNWAAYASDVSGKWEVYVRAFPDPGRATLISDGGGDYPRWAPDGQTLYYASGGRDPTRGDSIYAADLAFDPTIQVTRRRPVVDGLDPGFQLAYDVHPDGTRFFTRFRQIEALVEGDDTEAKPQRFHVIQNWFTELERVFENGGR